MLGTTAVVTGIIACDAPSAVPGWPLRDACPERGTAVADERRFADVESMRPVVRAAFGGGRSLLGVERLAHGSKKGAYRLTMDDGGTALAYAWGDAEDYWQGVLPEGAGDPADPFSHSSGLAL